LLLPRRALSEIPSNLFEPMGSYQSLPQAITHAITCCDKSYQELIWSNIYLFGGTSLIPGIGEHLEQRLTHLNVPVEVKLLSDRQQFPWQGCTLMKSRKRVPYITRPAYQEFGASVFHNTINV